MAPPSPTRPSRGQLCQLFVGASPAVATAITLAAPGEVLQVLDPRPLLDEAAAIAARYGGTGLLIAESLAAGLAQASSPQTGHGDRPTSACNRDWRRPPVPVGCGRLLITDLAAQRPLRDQVVVR